MVEGLFFLAPKDRQSFIKYCLKKTFCGTEMFDSAKAVYHWKTGGVNKAQKVIDDKYVILCSIIEIICA